MARANLFGQGYNALKEIFLDKSKSSYENDYVGYRAQGYTRKHARRLVRNAQMTDYGMEGIHGMSTMPAPAAVEGGTIANAREFFLRTPGQHIRQGLVGKAKSPYYGGALGVGFGAFRDSTYGFFANSFHRFRAKTAGFFTKNIHKTTGGPWNQAYHMFRSKGYGSAAAKAAVAESGVHRMKTFYGNYNVEDFSGLLRRGKTAEELRNPYRQGLFFTGVGVVTAGYQATHNEHGPLVGAVSAVGGITLAGAAGPLGWGLGKAMGAAGTRAAGRAAVAVGSRIGAFGVGNAVRSVAGSRVALGLGRMAIGANTILGGGLMFLGLPIAAQAAWEYGVNKLSGVGFRLSRKGFGNLYGRYQDNQYAMTMRQSALQAMSQSHLNARNALGGEAALMHLN